MSDLDDLDGDTQDATLLIWPPAPVPSPTTLRMLVKRAVEAMDEGAMKVDLILADSRHLDLHEIRQLGSRFQLERERVEPSPAEELKSTRDSDLLKADFAQCLPERG